MAFQTNTFQNNAFAVCAGRSPQKYKDDEDKQIILNLRRWEEEEEQEIILEYKRRDELDELVAKIARDKKEQDEIMEMLAALLLADES